MEKTIKTVFCVCDTPTTSGRMYDKESMAKALQELMPAVASGTLLGELDHPKDFDASLEESLYVKLSNASHIVKSVEMDEDGVVSGEIKLLGTPAGKIVENMLADGMKLYVRPCTLGVVNGDVYETDCIVSFDITPKPLFEKDGLELRCPSEC